MANEERPIIQRPNVDPPRPIIKRPDVEERPIIHRPTVDKTRPMIQPPDGAPQVPEVPEAGQSQGKPDTAHHPSRKVDKQAHTSRITHRSSFMGQPIELPYI